MDPVKATPAHFLLQRKAEDSHGTRPAAHGTAAAFASYGFGPLDDSKKTGATKPVSGAAPMGNPLNAHSLAWVTDVQATDSSSGTNKQTA